MALQNDNAFSDLYPLVLNADGKSDEKYSEDGLHLDLAGYERRANVLEKFCPTDF